MSDLLGKTRGIRAVVGHPRNCSCCECAIEPTNGRQRAREKRAWEREASMDNDTYASDEVVLAIARANAKRWKGALDLLAASDAD